MLKFWVLLSKLSIATQFLLVHLGQTVRNWSVATSNLKNFSRCGLWMRWCCLKADMQHYLLTLSLSLRYTTTTLISMHTAHADSTFISLEDYLKTVCRLLLNNSLLAVMLAFPGNSWGFLYKKHWVLYKHLLLSVCMSVCVCRSGTTSIISIVVFCYRMSPRVSFDVTTAVITVYSLQQPTLRRLQLPLYWLVLNDIPQNTIL